MSSFLRLLVLGGLVAGRSVLAGTSPPSNLAYATADTFYVGKAIAALTPTLTGSATSFKVAPALPVGLTLNETTAVIGGTPTTPAITSSHAITAANAAGNTSFALVLTICGREACWDWLEWTTGKDPIAWGTPYAAR